LSALTPLPGTEYLAVQVVQRTMDLLQIWVECFDSVDFRESPCRLLDALVKLVKDQMRPLSEEFGDRFTRSLDEFRYGKRKVEMGLSPALCCVDSSVAEDAPSFPSSLSSPSSLDNLGGPSTKPKWASAVSSYGLTNSDGDPTKTKFYDVTSGLSSCISRKKEDAVEDIYFGASVIDFNVVDQIRQCRRTEFQLLDVDDAQAEALKQRILKMSDQDIVSLASNNEVNFALKSNSDSKIHSALKNVKGIFKSSGKD